METAEIARVDYLHARPRIRIGWVIMLIGCILFLVTGSVDIGLGVMVLQIPEFRSDGMIILELTRNLVVAVLMILACVGGIFFLFDRSRLKSLGTLVAMVVLVVFVIDTVLMIRSLIHDLAGRTINPVTGEHYTASSAWLRFGLNLLDLQLSGGVYLIGWAIIKDYVGDDYDKIQKKA